jgi:hypothetical protein
MSMKQLVETDVFVLKLTTDRETYMQRSRKGKLYIATTFGDAAVVPGRYAAVIHS